MTTVRWMEPRIQYQLSGIPFHNWTLLDGRLWAEFHRVDTGYLLRYPGMVDFEISSDACEVTCLPAPGLPESTAKHLYVNQVLPMVLSKRGKLVFHASAVSINDSAVAFVGVSGRGKSTLAASFASNGFRFLADDALVLEPNHDGYLVHPGDPSLRLWEDSEIALTGSAATRAPAVHYTSKVNLLAGENLVFCPDPLPLRRVYFLGNGGAECLELTGLPPVEAVVEWLQHSVILDIQDRSRLASHFEQVTALARLPVHYRLDFPRQFSNLSQIRDAIIQELAEKCKAG